MLKGNREIGRHAPKLSFILLVILLLVACIAGGSSRADVLGQAAMRFTAWLILIVLILFAPPPPIRRAKAPALFLLAAASLVTVQLIPLPPSVWLEMPGRELFAEAAIISGQEQPWRPLSISPGATWNALSSLIVPIVALLLLVGISGRDLERLVPIVLGLVMVSSLLALTQFSGGNFDNPFVNDIGAVSGFFANRNHFALFAAIGCLLAFIWGFPERRAGRWRGAIAVALISFLVLIILATGSRMGMVVGFVSVVLGFAIVRRQISAELSRMPRKVAILAMVATAVVLMAVIAMSVIQGRAVSFDRSLDMEASQDIRALALPVVLSMTWKYFPFGAGFGTFDPAFRIDEPSELLGPAYFNLAHNDLLQPVLDGGVLGLALLMCAIAWWAWRTARAWRQVGTGSGILPKAGSVVFLLIIIASATDYPARTPAIMVIAMIAAVWLSIPAQRREPREGSIPATGSSKLGSHR